MCMCHTNHIVVCRKNDSNCLLENKMVSTLFWRRQITVSLFSQTFYGLLITYLTMYIINSQFLSCCTSQPKRFVKLTKFITVNSSMNAPISETS